MTLLAVSPDKFADGVDVPGARDRRGKAHTYDWRAEPGTAENTAEVQAAYTVTAVDRALTEVYSTDAHYVAYVIRRDGVPLLRQPRIKKASLPWMLEQGYRVALEALVVDVDNHAPNPANALKPLHVTWPSADLAVAEAARVAALLGSAAVYVTARGLRIVQPLSRAIAVEDCEVPLRVWLAQIEACGIVPLPNEARWLALDWSCTDWTRHFRAPHVKREGRDYRSPAVLLERMRHIDAPAGSAIVRGPKRKDGPPIDVGAWARSVAPADAHLVEPLSRALAVGGHQGERHEVSKALAGALLGRGVQPAGVPALVFEVCRLAGWDAAHHRNNAIDTVNKWARRQPVTGFSSLPEAVAEALEVGTDTRRAELAAKVTTAAPAMPLVETTRLLEEAIRSAPEGLSVIKAGCGLGKTRAARVVAVERAARGGAHKLNTKTGLVVPTNELALQVARDIEAEGTPVRRLFGPLSVRGPFDGYECRYRGPAAALAEGGQSTRRLFCTACEYREECKAVDGEEGPHDARILVGPHALLSELDAETGKTGLLFIDEPPSVLEDEVFSVDDLVHAERHLHDHFEARYARAMAPALRAVRVWAEAADSPLDQPGPLDRAFELGVDAELLDRAFDATGATSAQEAVACALDGRPGAPPLERRAFAIARGVVDLAKRIGRASKALRAVHRALTREGVTATLYDRGGRRLVITGLWLPLERALGREGRCVVAAADADLYLDAYEAVVGYRPKLAEYTAGDGAPVRRTLLLIQRANRRGWLGDGGGSLDSALRAAAAWVQEDAGTAAIGVITFQALEHHVRRFLREALPGLRVEVAHYGAIRGLDAWKGFDAVMTVGDPWPNLDHVSRELGGVTGDAVSARAEARARAELEQAHGRLRTVHRTEPGRALHVGALLPGGWCEPIEIRRPAVGRPRRDAPPPAELAELIEAAGGASDVARLLGRSRSTINRWLAGEGRPQASDLAALKAAGSLGRRPRADAQSVPVRAYRDPIRGVSGTAPSPDDEPPSGGPSRPSEKPQRRPLRAPVPPLAAPGGPVALAWREAA